MNKPNEIPRIFSSDDLGGLCANKAGLEELHQKIGQLLEQGTEEVALECPFLDDDFTSLRLADPKEPVAEEFCPVWSIIIPGILIGILILLVIGLWTVVSWFL